MGLLGRGGRHVLIVAGGVPHLAHLIKYKYCMELADVEAAAYIGRWRPSSVSPQAAAFAREVITKTARRAGSGQRTCCGRRGSSLITRSGWAWARRRGGGW